MNLGGFNGTPRDYVFGEHWANVTGFKVLPGRGRYRHYFGGNDWKLPYCGNCNDNYQQLFTFDLSDPCFSDLMLKSEYELPLISCLNCSSCWETQLYRINFPQKEIEIILTKDEQNWRKDDEFKFKVPFPRHDVVLDKMNEKDIPVTEERYDDIMENLGKDCLCRLFGAPAFHWSAK